METKERRSANKCRRIADRRNRFDSDYKGQEQRSLSSRRVQKDRRKSD